MKDALKDIGKEAILFGVSAVLLALAEPLIASAVGPLVGVKAAVATVDMVKAANPAIWLGAFFGTFGAIFATVRSTANYLFGDKKPEAPEKAEEKSQKRQIIISVESPDKAQDILADKQAWLKFKREVFADGSLSMGYLTDNNGLNFSRNGLRQLGVDASYDRNRPPVTLVKVVQEKLGVPANGTLDADTKDAIIADKTKEAGWIDDRKNAGAVAMLKADPSCGCNYTKLVDTQRSHLASAPMAK